MDRTNMPDEYLLGDKTWATIEPLLPTVYAGARRHDDRRIISGIVHVLRSGCRWKDCPAVYGPHTTVYNRFNRWSHRGRWQAIFDTLVATVPNDTRSIDSTSIKASAPPPAEKAARTRRRLAAPAVAERPRSMPSRTVRGGCFAFPSPQATSPTSRQATNWRRTCRPTDV